MTEQKFKVGNRWFYRGNMSHSWFFMHERADGSTSGIADRVPLDWWPLLEEIANLKSSSLLREAVKSDGRNATPEQLRRGAEVYASLKEPKT